LTTAVCLGVIGFVWLSLMYVVPLIHSLKNGNHIYLAFLVLIIISSTTESLLVLNKGIVFYTLFNCILFRYSKFFNAPEVRANAPLETIVN
jgi:hypothetical protein